MQILLILLKSIVDQEMEAVAHHTSEEKNLFLWADLMVGMEEKVEILF